MDKFDWEYIHRKCNLNEVCDALWHYSRFYSLRFSNIINMIEGGFYYEALLNMIILLEQIVASRTSILNDSFESLINKFYQGEKQKTAHSLRKLRNAMVHKFLFKYYVSFDNKEEFPLDEVSNYEHILFHLFMPIISCIDENYNDNIDFFIGEYTINDLAKQYGIENELDDLLFVGVEVQMSIEEKNQIKHENELRIMRQINNSSPVGMWTKIFKSLF